MPKGDDNVFETEASLNRMLETRDLLVKYRTSKEASPAKALPDNPIVVTGSMNVRVTAQLTVIVSLPLTDRLA